MTNHGLPNESPFRSYVVSELSISHIKRCESNVLRSKSDQGRSWRRARNMVGHHRI
ncbi:hypothetical protein M422DRAFT_28313 [Sphaerobolus stellatus SS14]|nr:hypothetical protein M422DRAFT_28313 [Sphaerobolus stellatus SS14]